MKSFGPSLEPFTELRPGIRRLVAPNPSMMTGPGTNTYLLGEEEVAVLDPGPLIDSHIERIIELADAPIGWILVTHTHPGRCRSAGSATTRKSSTSTSSI
jgi:glyoxylase-like metal-dependent hydrolase (beta-lactamase superfamily II)